MKKIILCIMTALTFPYIAYADPGLGAGSDRNTENSQSDSFKRDKRLEVDKAQGGRSSETNSREQSLETSNTNSSSERRSNNEESNRSGSIDININSLLLHEFINHYENRSPEDGMSRPQYVFALCKPLTGIISEYPTLGECVDESMGPYFRRADNQHSLLGVDREVIVPRRIAPRYGHCLYKGGKASQGEELGNNRFDFDPNNKYFSQYARCRILASKWVGEAGQMVSASIVTSESDAKEKIDQTFDAMDANPVLWEKVMHEASSIWSNANCSPTLQSFKDFEKPDIQCGIFQIDGQHVVVEGRPTLSGESIEGRSYKISMSSSTSTSLVTETGRSAERRHGSSIRSGANVETFKEHRKSASLSKSKSTEDSQQSGLSRKSDSSINASPKE